MLVSTELVLTKTSHLMLNYFTFTKSGSKLKSKSTIQFFIRKNCKLSIDKILFLVANGIRQQM